MKTVTLTNTFHNTQAVIRPREDGTISAATYRRAARALCPVSTCRCGSSSASGPDRWVLGAAEPIYKGSQIIAYRLYEE